MVDARSTLLQWAGKSLDCVRLEDGWTVVEPATQKQAQLLAEAPPISASAKAIAITGQRSHALKVLRTLLPQRPRLIYLDLPRQDFFGPEDPQLKFTTWLTLMESHIKGSFDLAAEDGFIAVHVDEPGAAYMRALLDDILGTERHVATCVWQKKYSPQNDLRGRIDDAQDLIFIYSGQPNSERPLFDTTWWPYELAGKTEDATRQFEKLRNEGIIRLAEIPKTSKPQKLLELLLNKLTAEGDYVVEPFSVTGFASIAALRTGRKAVYLVGETSEEKQVFDACGKPAIEHALRATGAKSEKLVVHDLSAEFVPKRVRLDLRENPIVYMPTAPAAEDTRAGTIAIRPMLVREAAAIGIGDGQFPPSIFEGPPESVLAAIEPTVRCGVRLAWCDLFEAHLPMDGVQPLLARFPPLLQADGILAVKVHPDFHSVVRLVCDGIFGTQQHVGTIALQTPDTSTSDYAFIIVYRALPVALKRPRKVGLPSTRAFTNPDGDPRGAWHDPGSKGARSGSTATAFTIRMPPYRWELVRGKLPPGAWRINPYSGVIFAERLEQAGTFRFTVRVTDSAGRQSESELSITVQKDDKAELPEDVWFIGKRSLITTKTAPRIAQRALPDGSVGYCYSVVLEASGGQPFDDEKEPGQPLEGGKRTRYWEFGRPNLIRGVLEDRVNFGARGASSPSFKVYEQPGAERKISVELGWWDDARLGSSAPIERLLDIFTKPDDLVLSLAVPPADGPVRRNDRQWAHIVNDASTIGDTTGYWIANLGEPIATFDRKTGRFDMVYDSPSFPPALAWAEGFLPLAGIRISGLRDDAAALVHGISADRKEAFHLLPESEWLTTGTCEKLTSALSTHFKRIHIYYFRGEAPGGMRGLAFHRIPFALNCRSKG